MCGIDRTHWSAAEHQSTSTFSWLSYCTLQCNIVPYCIELNGAPALMKCRWNVEQCASLYYLLQYSQYLVFLVFLNLSLSPTSLSLSFFSLSRSHSLFLSLFLSLFSFSLSLPLSRSLVLTLSLSPYYSLSLSLSLTLLFSAWFCSEIVRIFKVHGTSPPCESPALVRPNA